MNICSNCVERAQCIIIYSVAHRNSAVVLAIHFFSVCCASKSHPFVWLNWCGSFKYILPQAKGSRSKSKYMDLLDQLINYLIVQDLFIFFIKIRVTYSTQIATLWRCSHNFQHSNIDENVCSYECSAQSRVGFWWSLAQIQKTLRKWCCQSCLLNPCIYLQIT